MAKGRPPEKNLEREVRAFRWVRMLAALPRLAGSAAEREAGERVEEWLRELGVDHVEHAPVKARPRLGWSLALHLAVSLSGLLLGGFGGAALAGFAAWSFHREFSGGPLVLSRWLPAPASRNVVGRVGPREPRQRVVLSAHLDCAQAGWIFSDGPARLFARSVRRDGREGPPPGPHALPRIALLANAVLATAVWLGAAGFLVGSAQLLLGLGLAAGAAVTLQWATAAPSPGANDNASAVAAMLTCGEQLLAQVPEDTEVWIVATGAEEVGCCGMHAFCDAHDDWPRETTCFVNFECVGGGELHWVRSEGTLGKTVYPPLLPELARRVAASGVFSGISPTDLLAGTDGHVPARRGFAALSLISLEEDGVPRNYHRASDLPEAVDVQTIVRAADFGAAVAYAALRGEAGPLAIL